MKKYYFSVESKVCVEAENIIQAKKLAETVSIIGNRVTGYKQPHDRDFIHGKITIFPKTVKISQ